jgi:hypothetical protein
MGYYGFKLKFTTTFNGSFQYRRQKVSSILGPDAQRQGERWEGGWIDGRARYGDVCRPHKAFSCFVNNPYTLQIIVCNALTCPERNTKIKKIRIFLKFYYCIFTIYSRYMKRVISKRDGCEYLKQVPSIFAAYLMRSSGHILLSLLPISG